MTVTEYLTAKHRYTAVRSVINALRRMINQNQVNNCPTVSYQHRQMKLAMAEMTLNPVMLLMQLDIQFPVVDLFPPFVSFYLQILL